VVLTFTQTAAYIGVGLAGAAYLPQIWHLVHAHCAVGISRFAFGVWLVASLLVTSHAIATRAGVFIVLGAVQILAITVILVYATKLASASCGAHVSPTRGSRLVSRHLKPKSGGRIATTVAAQRAKTGR
jgi:hypothetical protein